MASVDLDRVWLNQVSDLTVSVSFFSSDRSDDRSTRGEVRTYTNGRLRLVTRVGSSQSLSVTGRNLSADQVAQLDDWRGTLLLLRDVWGRAVYGAYLDISVTDYTDRSAQDVAFQFQQVTFDPAV